MTWTKLDDNFHGHPKTRRLMRQPLAYMLHIQAINYSACHDLDGEVTVEFVEDTIPDRSDRVGAVQHLVTCRVWDEREDGWQIHDFLEYHPSRKQLEERRRKDAERKRQERGG